MQMGLPNQQQLEGQELLSCKRILCVVGAVYRQGTQLLLIGTFSRGVSRCGVYRVDCTKEGSSGETEPSLIHGQALAMRWGPAMCFVIMCHFSIDSLTMLGWFGV
jgi:hypothetical protein